MIKMISEWIKNGSYDLAIEFTHKYPIGKCALGSKQTVTYNLTKSRIVLTKKISQVI